MGTPAGTTVRAREWLAVAALAVALTIVMTWPLASGLGHLGRTRDIDADGQYSIWNVAWVARTLVEDPGHLFDANIYSPHKRTLAYSEANLVEGALGVPAYWLTKNPWLTLNVVMLFAFASAYACAYVLLRYLSDDGPAAAIGATLYAFCPFVFAHLSHIQLLMTGGVPLSLLLFHRLADAPHVRRGIALGAVLAVQALSCAYYGIFAGLAIGFAAIVIAISRGLWRHVGYWRAIAIAAATSIAIVTPFFITFLRVRAETGFGRTIDEAAKWAANPQSYLASAAHAHGWLLDYTNSHFEPWTEVLFPGLSALILGAIGLVVAVRTQGGRERETAVLYGSLAVVAFWASLGPQAGLYRALYYLPAFSFLRAPSRIGIVVVLCLAALASLAISTNSGRRPPAVAMVDGGRARRRGPGRAVRRAAALRRGSDAGAPVCRAGEAAARRRRRVSVLRRARGVSPARAVHALLHVALDAARERLQRRHPGRLPSHRDNPRFVPVARRLHRARPSPRPLCRHPLGHVRRAPG